MAAGDLSSDRSARANQTTTLLPNSSNSDESFTEIYLVQRNWGYGETFCRDVKLVYMTGGGGGKVV
jgi:hypothetical protein